MNNPQSLAQALKELEEMCEIKDDFILMQGDIVTNASLDEAIKMHYKGLAKVDKEKKPTPTIGFNNGKRTRLYVLSSPRPLQ